MLSSNVRKKTEKWHIHSDIQPVLGKRIEYWIIGNMLKEGLDVYVSMVDDDAVDILIKRSDGSFISVQIKARSKKVVFSDAALFVAIPHEQRNDYWFIF